jgi:hypothetical protein
MEFRALTAKYAEYAKSFLEIRSYISRGSHQSASVRRGKVRSSLMVDAVGHCDTGRQTLKNLLLCKCSNRRQALTV